MAEAPELGPPTGERAPVAWDLDDLPPARLRMAYLAMDEFAERLRTWGLTVPTCWHVVGHRVHLFAAVMWWRERAYRRRLVYPTEHGTMRIDPAAMARDAAEWQASPWGLDGMLRVWRELGCKTGEAEHDGTPTPTLAESMEAHVLANARRQRGSALRQGGRR